MKTFLKLLLFISLVSGCSNFSSPKETAGPGSFITGKKEQGIKIADFGNTQKNNSGLPINALLWRASLDVVSTIPLDDVDTFGGTIVTEWYQLNETSDERIKMTVFVLDRELRSDGIRVVVYVQNKVEGSWKDTGTDNEMGKKIEELILTRAREIRASGIVETNN